MIKYDIKYDLLFFAGAGCLLLLAPTYAAGKKPAAKKHTAAHPAPAPKPADTWKPSPALLGSLAKETTAGRYALRLPEDLTEIAVPAEERAQMPPGFDAHFYTGARRSDGTAFTFIFLAAVPPPGADGTPSLTEALTGAVEPKKHAWQDFVQSRIETGEVDGLTFERAYFKGVVSGSAGTRPAHGFAYVALDGTHILSFAAEDVEPYNEETIPLAQASVLTFHRRN